MSESLERLARNQALLRKVNERIEKNADDNDAVVFSCECSRTECMSTVQLSVAEYERVRSNSTWFLVKPGHDIPQIERVVSRDDGYVVVEKEIAVEDMKETDPRSDETQGTNG